MAQGITDTGQEGDQWNEKERLLILDDTKETKTMSTF